MQQELADWIDKNADELYHDAEIKWNGAHFNSIPAGWTYEGVESYGGEDQGSDYWSIWRFTHAESGASHIVKFQGWYQSYHGSEFTEWFEVEAYEKTVTDYRRI